MASTTAIHTPVDFPTVNKVRQVYTYKPNIHIFADEWQVVNQPGNTTVEVTEFFDSPNQIINMLQLYLNEVAGLATTDYFIGVYQQTQSTVNPNQGATIMAQDLIILIVDSGLYLPSFSTGGGYVNMNAAVNNAFPKVMFPANYTLCYSNAPVAPWNLANLLLMNTTHINDVLTNTPYTPVVNTDYALKKVYAPFQNQLAWLPPKDIAFQNIVTNKQPVALYSAQTYQELDIDTFEEALQFVNSVFIAPIGSANWFTYRNFFSSTSSAPTRTRTSDIDIIVSRILAGEFETFEELIRENPLMFITNGVYLFQIYRYATTKLLNSS